MYERFVLSNGRKLIDVAAILSIVVLLIMSIGLMTQNFWLNLFSHGGYWLFCDVFYGLSVYRY